MSTCNLTVRIIINIQKKIVIGSGNFDLHAS